MDHLTIRNNLETAIAAVEDYPEQMFNLEQFSEEQSCGTLYCTAGLLATIPHFQQQGLQADESQGVIVHEGLKQMDLSSIAGDRLFGHNAFERLFHMRGWGDWDWDLVDGEIAEVSDKQLAILRLKKQLELTNRSIARKAAKNEDKK